MGIVNKELYKGRIIKQVKGIVSIFDSFFEKEKFDQIIEIGTGNGAFSIYFSEKAYVMGAKFITYDIRKIAEKIKKEIISYDGKVITCDINKCIDVEDILKFGGRCLILNDGGLKVPQIKRFSKLIKEKDIILTHDYYKNESPASGIIVSDDVIEYLDNSSLRIINEDLFDDYLWLCMTRVSI